MEAIKSMKLLLSLTTIILMAGCAETERTYLQQVTNNSAIVKWRNGEDAQYMDVNYGTNIADLNLQQAGEGLGNDKEAAISGLTPNTTYYYALGSTAGVEGQSFTTAPNPGNLPPDGSTRVWIIGDSGTGNGDAKGVADGFYTFNGGKKSADLWLMLGDNAYNNGSDSDYQKAVFDTYPEMLKSTPLWPTIGNHEMGGLGISTDDTMPGDSAYLNIFSLPTNGEAGGITSGTEQYYSFDYANIHFVCLDSQVTARNTSKKAAMKSWLEDDLIASDADWKIVFFHHPPYSKGSHNSDGASGIDQPMTDMREEFTSVFDEHGVDLVYSGHSHSYERSFYIGGHTGLSSTFSANQHGEVNALGQLMTGKGDQAYDQVTNSGLDDKVVYTVAGSSGKKSGGQLNHPAHAESHDTLGSVVLDISATSIEAKMIGVSGNIVDEFTMNR